MHDKAFNVSRMQNMMDINMELLQCFYKSFDKKISDEAIKNDNICCGSALADMQLISKFNKGIQFLLCAINIFCKYT